VHQTINIGMIGFGYWGPVLLRNLSQHPRVKVMAVCDRNASNRERLARDFPGVVACSNADEVISDHAIQWVVVATQASSHFRWTSAALKAGKDVWVEKPFTTNLREAKQLVDLARKAKRILAIDHTYLFSDTYQSFKAAASDNRLGKLLIYRSDRSGFGRFGSDGGVIPSLIYHDLYVLCDLFKDSHIKSVSASATSSVIKGVHDVVQAHLEFSGGPNAYLYASMLSASKERRISLAGDRGILEWNDLHPSERLVWAKKSVQRQSKDKTIQYLDEGREVLPFGSGEPMATQVEYLVDCVASRKAPLNSGNAGLRVMKVLGALEKSAASGRRVHL
jgi:predicted dehydrogenase